MAEFNPDVKDVKPVNPIGWSKSADVPSQFASGLAEGIKGIGNLIGLGAEVGDKLVKQSAQQEAEKVFRPAVDDEAARLSGIDFNMKLQSANAAANASTNDAGPVKYDAEGNVDKSSLPQTLQQLPKTLSLLDGARDNGHLSETAYYGRLMSLAKDLRSQYPVGYRDYIDNQISKITGVDPANAYMKSIIGDINASVTNAHAERNKIAGKILENIGSDPINGRDMYMGFMNGTKSTAQALDFIGRNEAIDVNFKRGTQAFQAGQQQDELDKTKAKQTFQEYASSSVNSWIKGDLEKKGLTVEAIGKLIENPNLITPERFVELGNDVKTQMLTAAQKLRAEYTFSGKNPQTGELRPNSYSRVLGPEGSKIIDDALEPYQRIIDAIEKKDTGLLFTNQRAVEAMNSTMARRLFNDPSMRFQFGTMDAIRKHGGGDAAVTQFFSAGLEKKFGTDWGNYINVAKAEFATPDKAPGETPKQFNNVADFIKQNEVAMKKAGVNFPDSYKEVFSMVYATDGRPSLLNPNTTPASKQAIVKNFFSDQTQGFLNKIATDSVNDKGQVLTGRETLYSLFTSPTVANQIRQMDKATQDGYYNWVHKSYEDIFKQGIQDLANYSTQGTERTLQGKQVLRPTVGWDSDKSELVVDQGFLNGARKRAEARGMPASGTTDIELLVDKINRGIGGLKNAYSEQGLTSDEIQAKVINSLGLQIANYRMVGNLPTQFKAALDEKYRVRQEELAEERRLKNKRESGKND